MITATHRQDRTFHPPADYNPLAPTQPGGFPTEIPFAAYDIVVFENKFPSLRTGTEAAVPGTSLMPVRSSDGVCEVVCYSQNAEATLAGMPFAQIRKLTRVWQHRYKDLSSRPEVEYVFIFENKGKEIGVTLSHPHGQIYAYAFIPPVQAKALEAKRAYLAATGQNLTAEWLSEEITSGDRVVWENESFIAIVPFFARYPYEVHLTPKSHLSSLNRMTGKHLDDLAEGILVVARKLDALFGFSMPYIMSLHQEPAVPGYEFDWFQVQFYPPYRTADKLKYLAGSEAAAGVFINDTLPEVTAARLRELTIDPVH